MATIRKRKDKFVVIYDYIDSRGNRKQKWQTCTTKQEAQKLKLQIENQKINDEFINPSEQTLESFLQEWVEIHAKSHWQYNTYSGALSMIKNHIVPKLGSKAIQDITPRDIEKLYDSLRSKKISGTRSLNKNEQELPNLSSTTIRHIHNILKSAFDKAVKWEILAKSPVVCDPPKKNVVQKQIWDAESVKQALEDIDHPLLHLAVHLSFVCSLRIGEAMGLTWDDIDFSGNAIHITKTLQRASKDALQMIPSDNLIKIFPSVQDNKKSVLILKAPKTKSSIRKCFITVPLKNELLKRKAQAENEKSFGNENYTDFNLVFALIDGKPVEPKLCEKWFKKWQMRTALDLPEIIFHEIRHSSTTYKLWLSNGDIKSVQGDTGHASADMVVNTYSHIRDKARADLIASMEQQFYGQGADILAKNEQIKSLLTLAKTDPDLRQMLVSALNAEG